MATQTSLFTGPLMATAARDSFIKLDPRTLIPNPVMFVTAIVAALSTVLLIKGIATGSTTGNHRPSSESHECVERLE